MPRQHAVKAPDDESVEKSSVALRLGRRPVVVHTVHGFVEAIADVAAEMSWVKFVSCADLLVAMSASDFPGRDPLRTEQQ